MLILGALVGGFIFGVNYESNKHSVEEEEDEHTLLAHIHYCPICGHELHTEETDGQQIVSCPNCHYHIQFPTPSLLLL